MLYGLFTRECCQALSGVTVSSTPVTGQSNWGLPGNFRAMDAARLKSELFIASEELTAFVGRALGMLRERTNHTRKTLHERCGATARPDRRITRKPLGLQDSVRTRENSLQLLLTISLDPIVVITAEHSFADANRRALDLFGISRTNMMEFTIDTFLSYKAIAKCERYRSAFIKRVEKHGKCEIRRLDGSLRRADYIYIPNFAPLRHLFRFRNVSTNQFRPVEIETPINAPFFLRPKA
jgi:PAS domain-containing protein